MRLTKRNHYNPCFWTALWNKDYHKRMMKNLAHPMPARNHVVHSLNVKSGKIHKSKVEEIHYDKNLGIAEISREDAECFVKKYHSGNFVEFLIANKASEYPVFLDFEQILTEIEKLPPYDVLIKVAKKKLIETVEEKSYLGCFIVIQQIRSHAIMNALIQFYEGIGEKKFEHFITLKWMLSNVGFLFKLVHPLVTCRWTLFSVADDLFPLCDSPILVNPRSLMIALSPELLLEIDRTIPAREDECLLKRRIRRRKLDEFRRRTIGNTFREIIGNEKILRKWKTSPEFIKRVSLMSNTKQYNKMVHKEGNKEIWHINAYSSY